MKIASLGKVLYYDVIKYDVYFINYSYLGAHFIIIKNAVAGFGYL